MSVKNMHRRGRTRRQFLGDTAKVTAAGALAGGFPHVARGDDGVRTIGLAVSIINEIQSKASEDSGSRSAARPWATARWSGRC